MESYAKDLKGNLYKLWNRMTSGSYFPQAVREVQIPKKSGGKRSLGIPTISDRIAQEVVKSFLEPKVDSTFHADSYGYRKGKDAHQALQAATNRCRHYSWVIDMDIKGFFDNIDHGLLLKGLRYYTKEKWVLMYVERWLKVGVMNDGVVGKRTKGTPQGGVISPLLANIFMHFAFDKWMEKRFPALRFERYCDDVIVHCRTQKEASFLKYEITQRLKECNLELNEQKTHTVYCRDVNRREPHKNVSFDFLGHTFRPVLNNTKNGLKLLYGACMSTTAKKAVIDKIRSLRVHRLKVSIERLSELLNPMLRGWINYYCKFNKWTTSGLWTLINVRMAKWLKAQRKFDKKRAFQWLRNVFKTRPDLFAHWQIARP
ncbi:MAG: group II intron reverse transcriptase/maturase [Bacteroidota bacterium]|nr:group II intron reverse transcriptase/maturase [Bacteroidota bacterium]